MEQLFPISQQKADDDARLTALLGDIDEASRRVDENHGVGLFQVLTNHRDYATLADRLERGRDWIKAHYATGAFRCPTDREAQQ